MENWRRARSSWVERRDNWMAESAGVYCNEYGWRFEKRRNEVDKSLYGPSP
jgi:hypothetical protein